MVSLVAYYLPQNAGAIARNFIKDPEVLAFIDAEVRQYRFQGFRIFLIL